MALIEDTYNRAAINKLYINEREHLAYRFVKPAREGAAMVMFCGGFRSDMEGSKATALAAFCEDKGLGILRFDYRGHGASSSSFEEGTIGAWKDDALRILDEIEAPRVILAGSSMGGWIALLLALARPERVAGLVGIASAPDFTEELIWHGLPPEKQREIAQRGRIEWADCDGGEPYPITRALIEDGRNHLLLGGPLAIRCPVRLLHGMNDADVPWQTSSRLLSLLESADAQLRLFKTGTHRLSEPHELAAMCAAVEELAA